MIMNHMEYINENSFNDAPSVDYVPSSEEPRQSLFTIGRIDIMGIIINN